MSKERTKSQDKKNNKPDFECCPGDFQKMAKMMENCCSGQEGTQDCSALMKEMMQSCCGPGKEKTKTDEQK